jgi:uncharacterized protein YjbI with pentapeptide repeats
LVQAIEAGSDLHFQTAQQQPEIRAQALIDIILGKDITPPEEDSMSEETAPAQNSETKVEVTRVSRPVAIRSAGIRFANAKITGDLNLQDASGSGGSMLPRLKMVNCSFEKPIRLQRARLRSLCLDGSQFSMLDVSNAHIGGRVDLSAVRGVDKVDTAGNYGQCWVVMVSARIEGLVIARYARFVAPARRPDFVPFSWFANYALDLRSADIGGSVILRPRCRALGGISVTLANIQGSVWMSGAEVTAVEEYALSADYAVVRGSLYLRPYDPSNDDVKDGEIESVLDIDSKLEAELNLPKLTRSEPFRAKGGVSSFACKLGGSIYMDGAVVQKKPDAEQRSSNDEDTVDVRNAEIGGDCNFSAWQCETKRDDVRGFTSEIKVSLDAARIRNKLTFEGASVPSVSAKNIEVGGMCDFSAVFDDEQPSLGPLRFTSNGNVEITNAKIGGDLRFSGAMIGEKLRAAAGPAPRQGEQTKIAALSLVGSTIGGSCYIGTFAYKYQNTPEPRGIRFECYGVVRCSKASITRTLWMEGAYIESEGAKDLPTLDLAGSFIGGDVHLRTWREPGALESYRFEAVGGRTVIRLNGTRIGQDLVMNGSRLEARVNAVPQDRDLPRSVYALSAKNANIGGKVQLSTFLGKSGNKDAYLRFESTGLVSFAMATVSLGLDMEGSLLNGISLLKAPPVSEQIAPAGSKKIGRDNQIEELLALDLSDARLKFVRLGHDKWKNAVDVAGNLNLERSKIDAEANLSQAVVRGKLFASAAKVGASLDLRETEFSGAIDLTGAEIDVNLVLCGTKVRESLKADRILVRNSVLLEKSVLPTGAISHAIESVIQDENELTQKIAMRSSRNVAMRLLDRVVRWNSERQIYKKITELHITRGLDADVSFQNGQISHAFKVEMLKVEQSNAVSPGDLVGTLKNLKFCTIDLRELHVGELEDLGGKGWTEKVRLRLYGFRYDRLPEVPGSDKHRARWRKRWLNLQYFQPKRQMKREYSPDAYEHLASGLKAQGAYSVAQKIVSERLRLEYRGNILWMMFGFLFKYGYSIPRAIGVFVLCIGIGACAVYKLDTQPYNPDKMQTDGLTGTAGTAEPLQTDPTKSSDDRAASQGELRAKSSPPNQTILVMTTSTPEARYSYEKRKIFLIEPEETAHKHVDLVPCGNRVDPVLYAMDVFLPVLNLHQEENCSIRPEEKGWRRWQAAYAMVGWIITPLTILTFSGILRRHLDR